MHDRLSVPARLPWILACTVALLAHGPLATAESLPASIRSCASVTDMSSRLACFDQAVKPFLESAPSTGAAAPNAAAPRPAVAANAATPASPAAAPAAAAAANTASATASAPDELKHLTARIVSVESLRDGKVIRLDNGQVWQQVQAQDASADVNLRAGDAVTIDKGTLGTYWLAVRSGDVIKVKLQK
jgi:hypothetical protein